MLKITFLYSLSLSLFPPPPPSLPPFLSFYSKGSLSPNSQRSKNHAQCYPKEWQSMSVNLPTFLKLFSLPKLPHLLFWCVFYRFQKMRKNACKNVFQSLSVLSLASILICVCVCTCVARGRLKCEHCVLILSSLTLCSPELAINASLRRGRPLPVTTF